MKLRTRSERSRDLSPPPIPSTQSAHATTPEQDMDLHEPLSRRMGVVGRIRFELCLSWRFIKGDLPSTVLPGTGLALSACAASGLSWSQTALTGFAAVVLFWLYIYTFCTSNQAYAEAEDRINKPYRPIPQGLVTPEGTIGRFAVAMVLYSTWGALFGVLEWVLAWQAVTVLLNFVLSKRWWAKIAAMWIGATVELAAAWQLAAPLSALAWKWIAIIVVIYVSSLIVEDLRDLDGDRGVHRVRLVNVIGQRPTRAIVCIVQLIAPFVFHFALFRYTNTPSALILACDGIIAIFTWGTAFRVLTQRNPKSDHVTFMFFTCGYTAVCASGILLL